MGMRQYSLETASGANADSYLYRINVSWHSIRHLSISLHEGHGTTRRIEITTSYTDDADNCGLLVSPLGDGNASLYDIGYQRGSCTSLTSVLLGGWSGVALSLRGGSTQGLHINTL